MIAENERLYAEYVQKIRQETNHAVKYDEAEFNDYVEGILRVLRSEKKGYEALLRNGDSHKRAITTYLERLGEAEQLLTVVEHSHSEDEKFRLFQEAFDAINRAKLVAVPKI